MYSTNSASMKRRMIALLIDYLIIMAYGAFLLSISFLLGHPLNPLFENSAMVAQTAGFIFVTLPVFLYFFLTESSSLGGTIGKKKMSLKVVCINGLKLKRGRSFMRSFIKFLPWELAHFGVYRLILPTNISESTIVTLLVVVNMITMLYLITPMFNRERKSVYDWLAGTKVVKEEADEQI
ncbi:putative RDD family membrane protein YckC [Bacillus pakistanensis]|uniref:RDD family membrane protein YckC n=1 Tax=Rossellomorea pakistanensis TaxID=992288 RepID=A0ABS2NGT4_9BACI|nr:RDD family protein [Bacillus pakistanensis]MBM7587028.1 putative RDD family membrane protein YckC [Bacillus pakistanensis]